MVLRLKYFQSFTLKKYPAELSLVMWICAMGTVLNTIASLIMVRDVSAWKVGMDSGTLAAVYSVSTFDRLQLNQSFYNHGHNSQVLST